MIPKRDDLKKILNEHSKWIFSSGKAGKLADIKNWKLDKFNLENEDLPFAKLQFVSLRGANLSGINFRQADLLKGCFLGAYLNDADLTGANLTGGDFSFSKCERANFANANLEGAIFEGADLSEANFTKANLRCANFKEATLSSAAIVDANIEDANFQGANLEDTSFEGTDLDKANLGETYLRNPNIESINLQEVDHEDANFSDPIRNETKSREIGLDTIKSSKEDLFMDENAVNPEVIEGAILGLIEKVKSNIQFDQLKMIFKHQNFIDQIRKIDLKNGDIVTHKGQLAFKLDCNISYNLSLLLDRNGKLIKFSSQS